MPPQKSATKELKINPKGFSDFLIEPRKAMYKRKKLKIHLGNIMNIYRIVHADPRLAISRDLKSIKKISQ